MRLVLVCNGCFDHILPLVDCNKTFSYATSLFVFLVSFSPCQSMCVCVYVCVCVCIIIAKCVPGDADCSGKYHRCSVYMTVCLSLDRLVTAIVLQSCKMHNDFLQMCSWDQNQSQAQRCAWSDPQILSTRLICNI